MIGSSKLFYSICASALLAMLAGSARAETIVAEPADTLDKCNDAQSGDLCFIKGTHRRTLFPRNGVVYECADGAAVKGSDVVTGWQEDSTRDGVFVKRGWGINSQQVAINGRLLRQIGGAVSSEIAQYWNGRVDGDKNNLTINSFHYDSANDTLFIKPEGGTLEGKTVEVSTRQYIAHGYNVHGYTLRNCSFIHANSTAHGQQAALRLIGNNITLDSIKIVDTDGPAFTIRGDNAVVKNSLFSRNGHYGPTGSGRGWKFTDNEISHNNTRNFDRDWGAGGSKFMGRSPLGGVPGLHDAVFTGNKFIYNRGNGWWVDTDSRNVVLKDNVFAYNEYAGIFCEWSYVCRISGNYVYGNGRWGVHTGGQDSVIENNLIIANGRRGIFGYHDPRVPGGPLRNKLLRNIVGWSGEAEITVPNRSSYPWVSDDSLYLNGSTPKFLEEKVAIITGLGNWQDHSGYDRQSRSRSMPLPASIADAINDRRLITDWTPIEKIAREVDPESPPGPWGAETPPPPPPPPPPPVPVDCVVSAWGEFIETEPWRAVSETEEQRTLTRTRTVTTQPKNGGAPCPVLSESTTETRPLVPETDAEKIARLTKELAAAYATANSLRTANQSLQTQVASLQAQIADLTKQLDAAKAQRTTDLATIKRLTGERDAARAELARVKANVNKAVNCLQSAGTC